MAMRLAAATGVAVLLLSLMACQGSKPGDPDDGDAESRPTERTDPLPPELTDPARPPAADLLLPPLPGFRVDDDVEAGEIRSSLDHGEIAYVDVRRRLILGPDGFAIGDVMVVTFQPETDGGERFLRHWFGDAPGEPVDIAGIEMLRIADPHETLVWAEPHFVIVFGRGQGMTREWLEEVARATVEALSGGP